MRLIVISGTDGVGKTTLIDALASTLRAQGRRVAVASLWDLYKAPELPRIFHSRADAQAYLQEVSARSRLHFFLHCLFGAWDRVSARDDVDDVLFDAYWFKYVAAEVTYGARLEPMLPLLQSFPVPDVILELDAPVHVTAARKHEFGSYESGGVGTRASFVAFQSDLRHTLRAVVRAQPSRLVELDATLPTEQSVARAVEALANAQLRTPPPSEQGRSSRC